MKIKFTLNGKNRIVQSDPQRTLGSVLRDECDISSVNPPALFGHSESSAILLNNVVIPSWFLPIFLANNKTIITLEHFQTTAEYQFIKSYYDQAGLHFCSYCSAGKILFSYSILQKKEVLSEKEIKRVFSGVFCRCSHIENVVATIKKMQKKAIQKILKKV